MLCRQARATGAALNISPTDLSVVDGYAAAIGSSLWSIGTGLTLSAVAAWPAVAPPVGLWAAQIVLRACGQRGTRTSCGPVQWLPDGIADTTVHQLLGRIEHWSQVMAVHDVDARLVWEAVACDAFVDDRCALTVGFLIAGHQTSPGDR